MRYLDAYKYVFKSPNWLTDLLLGAAAGFVPIAGPIVLYGYLFETVESMRRTGAERPPDPDFNRLQSYLLRGVWPFLVALLVSVVFALLIAFGALAAILGSLAVSSAVDPNLTVAGFLAGYLIAFAWTALLGCLMNMVLVPMILRAAYRLEFGAAFDFAYLKDFYKRVGKELFLSQVFLALTTPLLALAGFLVLCVGIYLAMSLAHFAQFHFLYQLLRLYEERGGTPLAFKSSDPVPLASHWPDDDFRRPAPGADFPHDEGRQRPPHYRE